MAIKNAKEGQKEFNLALRHFRNAVKLAKKNLIIGEVRYEAERKQRKVSKTVPPAEGSETT